MHMIKELCDKIRVILWERDMPLYLLNESRRYNLITLMSQDSFQWSLVPTHTLSLHLHEEDPVWLDGQMEASSFNSNRVPHTILSSILHSILLSLFLEKPSNI
jgi:hypothetical protein